MVLLNSLSPSRANDFVQCPLKYRLRVVDKLPEPPSAAALKGTLVHAVLEAMFDWRAEDRTAGNAKEFLPAAWAQLKENDTRGLYAGMFPDLAAEAAWLAAASALLESYFTLELPQNLEPEAREKFLETTLDSGLVLRGFIDRVDRAPGGEVRIVDYKSGKAPAPQYSREAQFQMKFYALLVYRNQGVLPHTLQLMYLGNRQVVQYHPTMSDVERTEAQVLGIWEDVREAARTLNWRPRKSKLCGWCHFKSICPAFGNQAPEVPQVEVA